MHFIEWWHSWWPRVTLNPQTTPITTVWIAFYTFVAGEHRELKFDVQDCRLIVANPSLRKTNCPWKRGMVTSLSYFKFLQVPATDLDSSWVRLLKITFVVLNLCNTHNSGNIYIACLNPVYLHINCKAHPACDLNFIVKSEGLLKVTGNHVQ